MSGLLGNARRAVRSATFHAVAVGCVATAASFGLVKVSPAIDAFKSDQLDLAAQHFRPLSADPDIVLVLVDADTPAALGRPKSGDVPLKLLDYARAIEHVVKGTPSVVLCDIELGSAHGNRDKEGQAALRRAAQSMGQTRLVVPASAVVDAAKGEPPPNPEALGGFDYKFVDPDFVDETTVDTTVGHALTLHPGEFDIGINPVLHRFPSGDPILHVAVQAVLLHRKVALDTAKVDLARAVFESGLGTWELTPGYGLDTLWTDDWRGFETLSFHECLAMRPEELAPKVSGKIVVIGDARPGMDESAHTAKFQEVIGVHFVANTVNTLLKPATTWPRFAPLSAVVAACFVVACLVAFALTRRASLWRFGLPLALLVAALASPWLLAVTSNLYVDPVEPGLSVVFAAAFMGVLLVVRGGWFESRVPGSLVECAVLFVDLEDSTGMTVREGARTYQEVFTEFARRAAVTVQRAGGTVERTTGDGFIATFATGHGAHPAVLAVECAKKVAELAMVLGSETGHPLVAHSGVEFGLVSGGLVIEAGRSVWSSSGKTVVLAQRILAVAAETASHVAVGPVAASFLREESSLVKLGVYSLKGIEGETEVFTVG